MIREEMKRIVREYVRETLERCEKDRAERTRITVKPPTTVCPMPSTLPATQLRTNDLRAITPIVDHLLTTHGLSLEKDSTEYRLFSRLVLQGFISVLKVEGERWDSGEEELTPTAAPVNGTTPERSVASRQPTPTKLLSAVITAYFKEHKREPRTDSQIRAGFERFITAIGGDCPIGEITKEKCRSY